MSVTIPTPSQKKTIPTNMLVEFNDIQKGWPS